MPIYNYQAFDAEGTLHKGSKDADSESEVRQYLRSRDLFPRKFALVVFIKQISVKVTIQENKVPQVTFSQMDFRKGSYSIHTTARSIT